MYMYGTVITIASICYSIRHQHSSSTQSESNTGSESPSGPLKARKKLGARKASEENLLDDSGSSSGKVLRPASSAEDLHTLNAHNSPKVAYTSEAAYMYSKTM